MVLYTVLQMVLYNVESIWYCMADTCQTLCTRHCTRHCTMYCILYSSWLDIFQTLHSTVRCAVNWTDPVYSTSLCFDFCNKNPKTSTHRAVLNRRGLCNTHCVWLNRSGLCIAGLTVAKHEHEADASYGGEGCNREDRRWRNYKLSSVSHTFYWKCGNRYKGIQVCKMLNIFKLGRLSNGCHWHFIIDCQFVHQDGRASMRRPSLVSHVSRFHARAHPHPHHRPLPRPSYLHHWLSVCPSRCLS